MYVEQNVHMKSFKKGIALEKSNQRETKRSKQMRPGQADRQEGIMSILSYLQKVK